MVNWVVITWYDLNDFVAGAFTGVPSSNENFDPLQGSVTVKPEASIVTAHFFSG